MSARLEKDRSSAKGDREGQNRAGEQSIGSTGKLREGGS
jgi:hypothetical protein